MERGVDERCNLKDIRKMVERGCRKKTIETERKQVKNKNKKDKREKND